MLDALWASIHSPTGKARGTLPFGLLEVIPFLRPLQIGRKKGSSYFDYLIHYLIHWVLPISIKPKVKTFPCLHAEALRLPTRSLFGEGRARKRVRDSCPQRSIGHPLRPSLRDYGGQVAHRAFQMRNAECGLRIVEYEKQNRELGKLEHSVNTQTFFLGSLQIFNRSDR